MELNGRMVCIIQELLEADKKIHARDIYTKLGLSRRTFYYDVKKINDWLEDGQYGSLLLKNGVCELRSDIKAALQEIISSDSTAYYMDIEERKIMMVACVTLSGQKIIIDSFCRIFDITKNTVLSDFKSIKNDLSKNNIELVYNNKAGYIFVGDELAIRKYLWKQYKKIRSNKAKEAFIKFLGNELSMLAGSRKNYYDIFKESLLIYEESVQTNLIEYDIDKVTLMIAATYLRNADGHIFQAAPESREKIESMPAFKGVQALLAQLEKYTGLRMAEEENYFITMYLAGVQTFDLISNEEHNHEITDITRAFLKNVEDIGHVVLKNREELFERMALHIEPMVYRIRFGSQLENPIAEAVKNAYMDAFELARQAFEKASPDLAKSITDDEIVYLAVYIAGEIKEENRHASEKSDQKILIVCGEGVATAILVKNQMIDLLGDYYEYELASAKHLLELEMGDYLIVISTIKSDFLRDDTIRVGVLLKDTDKEEILKKLNKAPIYTEVFSMEALLERISKYIKDEKDLENINLELLNYFHYHR